MSWFTSIFSSFKFPPPADSIRPHEKRLLEEPVPVSNTSTSLLKPKSSTEKPRNFLQDPANRNKIIFGAGLGFFAFSVLITRRSFARRKVASRAAFYTNAPGHQAEQSANVSAPMEAVEALNIATINVLSVMMMVTGGTLWYLDINNMHEARKFIRGGLGVDGTGRDEQQAEEEFEEWMATVLSRKDAKDIKNDGKQ